MANPTQRGQQDANRGYALPNTQGMNKTQAQQAQNAFEKQKAANAKKS